LGAPAAPEHERTPPPPAPPEASSNWLWLSFAEQRVVAALRGRTEGWTTAEKIADAAGRDTGADADYRSILRNMVERGILLSSQGRGYRLHA
jgi:hypothetical protein